MTTSATNGIVVYWRPGCVFCSALLRNLDRRGVQHDRVDIWSDANAAARVRHATGGNETVPTVFVGSLALVNPNVDRVLAAAMEHAPGAVPAGYEPHAPGRLRRWFASKLNSASTT
ncbi:glutaredoxin family protein [Ilumatobacter sp.]|uniref:glutaredoxin family protein n=1 Tax=Ilumatobacter sp. TaxID=1967498 RepID=UPI003750FA5B